MRIALGVVGLGVGLCACAEGYMGLPWADSGLASGDASASPEAGVEGGDGGANMSPPPAGDGGASPPGAQPMFADCPEPKDCVPNPSCAGASFGNAFYFFCGAAATWDEAVANCAFIPGTDLVMIESKAEDDFIASKVAADMWLGGRQTMPGLWTWAEGKHFWSGDAAGTPVDGAYTHWAEGHPNDAGDCMLFFSARKAWAASSCTLKFGYVCKREQDLCPDDPDKKDPGVCGCGEPETDTDGDGALDCQERCPKDPNRTSPGTCGCIGEPDAAPAGTECDDGQCAANTECDGKGSCGSPDECCEKATCGPTECGTKPDGCGSAVLCDFQCPPGQMCVNNACGCAPEACPPCDSGLRDTACCMSDGVTCGCTNNVGNECRLP